MCAIFELTVCCLSCIFNIVIVHQQCPKFYRPCWKLSEHWYCVTFYCLIFRWSWRFGCASHQSHRHCWGAGYVQEWSVVHLHCERQNIRSLNIDLFTNILSKSMIFIPQAIILTYCKVHLLVLSSKSGWILFSSPSAISSSNQLSSF